MFKEQALPTPDTAPAIKKPPMPTGAAFSARFETIDKPANDDVYSKKDARRIKQETQKENIPAEPKNPFRQRDLLYPYFAQALKQGQGLAEAVDAWRKDAAQKHLLKSGALVRGENGEIFADISKLKKYPSYWKGGEKTPLPKTRVDPELAKMAGLPSDQIYIKSENYFEILKNTQAVDSHDKERGKLSITTLPSSIEEIAKSGYPPCHLKPWEIPAIIKGEWAMKINLSDNSHTNIFELYLADFLKQNQASRDSGGILTIVDPRDNTRKPVSGDLLERSLNRGAQQAQSKLNRGGWAETVNQQCRNLSAMGIIHSTDLKRVAVGFHDSLVPPSDRKISSHQVSLQTPGGLSAQYYLGREKIVGSDVPWDHENMVIRYLDEETCAIVLIEDKQEEILFTFPLLTIEEAGMRQKETKERFKNKGRDLTKSDLANRTMLGGPEMKKRIHEYNVADYLPREEEEDDKSYALRIQKLSNARLVSKDTRSFFRQFDIPLHRLPWEEQLWASSILIDPRFNRDEIASFCKQFGVAGLRTFISSTFGENINKQILALGERSPDIAKMVFDKYGEILTAARDVESVLLPIIQKKSAGMARHEEVLRSVKAQLIRRAKLIIEQIANTILNKKNVSAEVIESLKINLSRIQSDIELFASTIKTATEADVDISIDDFADASTATLNGQDVPKEDRERMLIIYAQNFKGNPKKQTRLLEEFSTALDSGKTKLYTLHYQRSLLSFIRFDEKDDHTLYAGSFNVDPNVRGMKIGEAMMKVALDTEAKNHILTGSCAGYKTICAKYIEGGFVGVDTKTTEGGEINLELIRDDKRHHLLKGSTLTPEEIVSLSLNNTDENLLVVTIPDDEEEKKDYKFTPLKNYFLTRYLQPSKKEPWYLVFEKRPKPSQER